MRGLVTLTVDTGRELAEPSGRALQFVARLDDRQAPLEALVVGPEASRLLIYFPGFNTPLGPWRSPSAACWRRPSMSRCC